MDLLVGVGERLGRLRLSTIVTCKDNKSIVKELDGFTTSQLLQWPDLLFNSIAYNAGGTAESIDTGDADLLGWNRVGGGSK